MEQEQFTREELVAFGHYLLSKERENRIASAYIDQHVDFNERLRRVYHSDIENFQEKGLEACASL